MRKPPRAQHVHADIEDSPFVDRDSASLELSELRHRTENLLQTILGLLSLEAKRAEQAETRERLFDLSLRVDLLANLHQRLNALGPGGELDAGALIRDSAAAIFVQHDGRITLECEVEKLPLDGKRAQSLALLVHEALTNVSRHAFQAAEPGRVVVRARATAMAGFVVEVEDNGRGMRPAQGSGGLGLRLMRALALRLGGELQLQDCRPGLKLALVVPPLVPIGPENAESSAGLASEGQPNGASRPRRSSAPSARRPAASSMNGLAHSTS